jgi:hypothetical protein
MVVSEWEMEGGEETPVGWAVIWGPVGRVSGQREFFGGKRDGDGRFFAVEILILGG